MHALRTGRHIVGVPIPRCGMRYGLDPNESAPSDAGHGGAKVEAGGQLRQLSSRRPPWSSERYQGAMTLPSSDETLILPNIGALRVGLKAT